MLLSRATAENILNLIPGIETKSERVRGATLSRIESYVAKNEAVQIVLPAFPAKSPNRHKTLGHLPDYGEVLALSSIQRLTERIQLFYKPGAKVIICSDGRVFSDLVGVSDTSVNAYSIGIDQIVSSFSMFNLKTFSLDDVFAEHTFFEMREALVEEFGTPLEEVRQRYLTSQPDRALFNGIHRFIFEDRISLDLGKSRSKVRDESKHIATQVIQRSNAWSSVVEKHFPHAIRLSIHPQHRDATKIPIRLLPSENIWRTPWHGVVVKEGESVLLKTRREALQEGATYKEFENTWGYFEKEMA